MTNVDDAYAEIEARARAWLVRLRSEHATQDDVQAFRRWCAEHPDHARVAREVNKTWSTLSVAAAEFAAQRASAGHSKARRPAPLHALRPGRRAFVGFAVAAGASWLALRPPLQLWPALGDFTADYRTGTGEQRQVALSDRVMIEMNTQTRINVLPSDAQRGIDLLAGEAAINATAPADRSKPVHPVLVVAGRGRLQFDTARFNVRRAGDAVCVTCLSGSVTVTHPRRQLTVLADQQLLYDDRDVQPVSRVDTHAVMAWRQGLLIFDGAPLTQVVDEINRYRPGKVILRNVALGERHVKAKFSIAKLDDAVDMICQLYGAHVTALPGNIALLS